MATHLFSVMLHNLIVVSKEALANSGFLSSPASVDQSIHETSRTCSPKDVTGLDESIVYTLTVLSSEQDARYFPDRSHLTILTSFWWSWNTFRGERVSCEHTVTEPSVEAVANIVSSFQSASTIAAAGRAVECVS